MDCCNKPCNKKAIESISCRECYERAYCSDLCLVADWSLFHKTQCRKKRFALSDFAPSSPRAALGKGAFGRVQLVRHIRTSELFALKEIPKYTKQRKIPFKILFREISIQKKLIHGNIIRLFGHIECPDRVFLVLEYASGGNLYQLLQRKPKLPEREACFYFSQICQGVSFLHKNNIMHRDLKPDNVLLTQEGLVKICDFGWCTVGVDERITYCGTLDYMAPEILGGEIYNEKVDVWALGVILFEMLEGVTPFKGRSASEKLEDIKKGALEFRAGISKAAASLIRMMLDVQPDKRPKVTEIMAGEWLMRYACGTCVVDLLKVGEGDQFGVKISKNYPPSFRRTGVGRKVQVGRTVSMELTRISFVSDENSNVPNEEGRENVSMSVLSDLEIEKRQAELVQLQKKIEKTRVLKARKGSKEQPTGIISKIFNFIGLT